MFLQEGNLGSVTLFSGAVSLCKKQKQKMKNDTNQSNVCLFPAARHSLFWIHSHCKQSWRTIRLFKSCFANRSHLHSVNAAGNKGTHRVIIILPHCRNRRLNYTERTFSVQIRKLLQSLSIPPTRWNNIPGPVSSFFLPIPLLKISFFPSSLSLCLRLASMYSLYSSLFSFDPSIFTFLPYLTPPLCFSQSDFAPFTLASCWLQPNVQVSGLSVSSTLCWSVV